MHKQANTFTAEQKILTKLYNGTIYGQREKALHAKLTNYDLLEIDNWTQVTPEMLQKHIDRGEIVDWVDGYDSGPTPLTNALQQGASSEIIAMLIANGANVDTPTVLPSGTKVTPLEIVRLQAPTHNNLQKELMLLRAGAKDDVINWIKKQ